MSILTKVEAVVAFHNLTRKYWGGCRGKIGFNTSNINSEQFFAPYMHWCPLRQSKPTVSRGSQRQIRTSSESRRCIHPFQVVTLFLQAALQVSSLLPQAALYQLSGTPVAQVLLQLHKPEQKSEKSWRLLLCYKVKGFLQGLYESETHKSVVTNSLNLKGLNNET